MAAPIPEVVILRLPLYFRVLTLLQDETEIVSSQELGARLQITPAQIRKDLSYFGKFGIQGKGYKVNQLLGELRQILGLDRKWSVVLVGVGRLGRAILDYSTLGPHGFHITAAFDTDPRQIGKKVGQLIVQDIAVLSDAVKNQDLNIGIVAVPPSEAQEVIDRLVSCGIKAILNYAPAAPAVHSDVRVYNIDPVVALQTLTYHLKCLSTP
ncbi:MAG: redox-sensing transcriptional repressor Rex [Dehalococcoidia bacterium]|jgi:redox-sensing transcriptional repressor|nr:redox-sensing transcriptional repressor Rex [Chloroflexota bacterium]MCK4242490.1 redox-sensing transcriptional repressor Rex [Dehalococcoidia bacterium]